MSADRKTRHRNTADVRKGTDFTKMTWVHLGSDIGARANEYMAKTGHNDAHAVMRELVSIALSVDPANAITNAVRIKAHNDVRTWMVNRIYTFLNGLYRELQQEIERGNQG